MMSADDDQTLGFGAASLDPLEHDEQAERLLVGALLAGNTGPALGRLRVDWFHGPEARVFAALTKRRAAREPMPVEEIAAEAEVSPVVIAEMMVVAQDYFGSAIGDLVLCVERAHRRRRLHLITLALQGVAAEADVWRFDGVYAELAPSLDHVAQALGGGAASQPAIDCALTRSVVLVAKPVPAPILGRVRQVRVR